MPEISRFYGMIVKMFFQQREHNPPHVHILYGDYMGSIEIETLKMSEGDLPPKALAMGTGAPSRIADDLEHTKLYKAAAAGIKRSGAAMLYKR